MSDKSPGVFSYYADGSFIIGIKNRTSTDEIIGLSRVEVSSEGESSIFSPAAPIAVSLVSGIDITQAHGTSASWVDFAAFDENGNLQDIKYTSSIGGSSWRIDYFSPPSERIFQFSPAICRSRFSDTYPIHLVATADNLLWISVEGSSGFSPWQQISDTEVFSSPDCDISENGAVNVVVRTIGGAILHVSGKDSTFSETELGASQ